MLTNAEITKKAREALQDNWGKTVGIYATAMILVVLATAILEYLSKMNSGNLGVSALISIGSEVVDLLILSPIALGILYVFYGAAFKQNIQVGDLLQPYGGHKYWRNILVLVLIEVISGIAGVIIALPFIIGLIVALVGVDEDALASVMHLGADSDSALLLANTIMENPGVIGIIFISIILSLIIFAIVTTIFEPVLENLLYLIANNQTIGGFKSIRHAFRITKGNKAKYWGLFFRFTGWYMLLLIPIVLCAAIAAFLPSSVTFLALIVFGIITLIMYLIIKSYSSVCFAILYREMEKKYAAAHPEDPNRYIPDMDEEEDEEEVSDEEA